MSNSVPGIIKINHQQTSSATPPRKAHSTTPTRAKPKPSVRSTMAATTTSNAGAPAAGKNRLAPSSPLPPSAALAPASQSSIPLPMGAGKPFDPSDYSNSASTRSHSGSSASLPGLVHAKATTPSSRRAPSNATGATRSSTSPVKRSQPGRKQPGPHEEADPWDMPKTRAAAAGMSSGNSDSDASNNGATSGHDAQVRDLRKPVEQQAMTWQQEELSTLAISSTPAAALSNKPKASKAKPSRSNRKAGPGESGPGGASTKKPSQADSNPNLNWQEALSSHSTPAYNSGALSPAKNGSSATISRRQQLLDESTFGPAPGSPVAHSLTDVFSSALNTLSPRASPARRPSPASQSAQTATPTRNTSSSALGASSGGESVEPRYAGPTFHNSPAPSTLGIPSFLAKKRAAAAASVAAASL